MESFVFKPIGIKDLLSIYRQYLEDDNKICKLPIVAIRKKGECSISVDVIDGTSVSVVKEYNNCGYELFNIVPTQASIVDNVDGNTTINAESGENIPENQDDSIQSDDNHNENTDMDDKGNNKSDDATLDSDEDVQENKSIHEDESIHEDVNCIAPDETDIPQKSEKPSRKERITDTPDEIVAKIKECASRGMPMKEISKTANIAYTTVRKYVHLHNIEVVPCQRGRKFGGTNSDTNDSEPCG